MKILSAIINKLFPVGNSSFNSPSWLWSSGINPNKPDKLYTEAEVGTLSAVYRAGTLYSDSLGASKWSITQTLPTGGHKTFADTDAGHALNNWNFADREFFIFSSIILGNGYAEIIRDGRNNVVSIETIATWRVSPEWQGENLVYRVAADESMNAKVERIIPAADMIHMRHRVTGRHSILGESVLSRLLPALDACLRIRESQSAVFRNLASPGTVISTEKPLPPKAAERLSKAVKEFLSGKKLGSHLMLDNGLELKHVPIAETINLQLLELARFSIDEVARCFGLSSSLLAETGNVNNATASEQNRQFATISLKPMARRLEDAISEKLFTREQIGAGLKVSIDLLPLLLGSGKESSEYYSKLVAGSILSTNESRNALGFADVAGGDELAKPVNSIPISFWSEDYKPGQAPVEPEPEPEPEKEFIPPGKKSVQKIMGISS